MNTQRLGVRWLGLAFLTGILLPATLAAEPPATKSPISVAGVIEPSQVTVGDLATWSIRVTHPPGFRLTPPKSEAWEGFDLVDQGVSAPRRMDGRVEEEFWFRLRADRVGHYTLSGPEIAFQAPDHQDPDRLVPGTVRAPDVKIQIRSVLYAEGQPQDIHDIKPIIGAAPWWQHYLGPILGLAGLAFLAGFLVERWVKRRRNTAAAPAPPLLPAHELALRELQHLYDKGYLQQGRFRELYFELSEIFRRYLGLRYRIPALDWTTEEIAFALNRHPEPQPEHRAHACRILNATDLVKFAKLPVDADVAVEQMKSVRDFIRLTTPKAKPPAAPDAPASSASAP